MGTERLPRTKYIRQLRAMAEDLAWWKASYEQAALSTSSDHLSGRFSGRAIVLEEAIHQVDELVEILGGLPRIS